MVEVHSVISIPKQSGSITARRACNSAHGVTVKVIEFDLGSPKYPSDMPMTRHPGTIAKVQGNRPRTDDSGGVFGYSSGLFPSALLGRLGQARLPVGQMDRVLCRLRGSDGIIGSTHLHFGECVTRVRSSRAHKCSPHPDRVSASDDRRYSPFCTSRVSSRRVFHSR